jgi:hypothetical protein
MVRLAGLCLQNTNKGGEPSSHDVVIDVVIWRKKAPAQPVGAEETA